MKMKPSENEFIKEDAVNSCGTGAIAGIGIGKDGEYPVSFFKNKLIKVLSRNNAKNK